MHTAEGPIVYEPYGEGAIDRDVYERLLERAPVYQAASGVYVVSRYADVRSVNLQPEVFSSKALQKVSLGMWTDDDPDFTAEDYQRLVELTAGFSVTPDQLLKARMIMSADPPHHTIQRKIISRAFLPGQLAPWRIWITEQVEELLAGIDGETVFELNEVIGIPLPVRVIGRILALDPEDHWRIKRWSDEICGGAQGPDRGSPEALGRILRAYREYLEFLMPRIEARRLEPTDDMISVLVRAEEQTEALSIGDTLFFLLAVLVAGNETTTHLIGTSVVELLTNPDQLELLNANPDLIDNTIEETLRLRPPAQTTFRIALADTEVGGVPIPAGATVISLFGAANLDPDVFPDPRRFDIQRTNASAHLAFGHGIHFCIGAALARLEGAAVLRGLLPILPRLKLAEPPEMVESLILDGYKRVHLEPK